MCGRAYETYTQEEVYFRYLNKLPAQPLPIKPNYNLAPSQYSPVVFMENQVRQIQFFRWGLLPSWAKDIQSASKYSLINARFEEIEKKRSYKVPFEKRRCIVPLSGFFEWKATSEGPKQPYAIFLKSHSIMSVAGIWEKWTPNSGSETISSFSILTTKANSFMKEIHNRMPLILDSRLEAIWLDPSIEDKATIEQAIKDGTPEDLDCYKVSTLVNSVKNNTESLLDPVAR